MTFFFFFCLPGLPQIGRTWSYPLTNLFIKGWTNIWLIFWKMLLYSICFWFPVIPGLGFFIYWSQASFREKAEAREKEVSGIWDIKRFAGRLPDLSFKWSGFSLTESEHNNFSINQKILRMKNWNEVHISLEKEDEHLSGLVDVLWWGREMDTTEREK